MINKLFLGTLAVVFTFGFCSCAVEKERQVVLPESDEDLMPWNRLQPGEGLGQFGAFQQR